VLITTTDTTTICSSIIGDAEFILEISDQNCTSYDTISITTHPLPTADAGTDILLLYGSIVNLGGSPTGPSGASFLWLPLDQFMYLDDSTSSNPEIELLQQYTYTVTVTDTNNCVSTDDILVTPIPEITYPSGFSPNSDGVNDNWLIENIDEFPNCVVEIYNRWGEMLFRSVGYNDKWGGNFRNKPLPVGTYYYIIELNDSRFPNPYTGPVTIMR
jgi:gliding motility-associated-like protein